MAWQVRIDSVTRLNVTTLQAGLTVYDDVAPLVTVVGSADVLVSDTQQQARTKIIAGGTALRDAHLLAQSAETTRAARAANFVGTVLAL